MNMRSLSLVVPVCNDLSGVRSVVASACSIGIFDQIILSDDASDAPLSVASVLEGNTLPVDMLPKILVLRSEQRCGAGVARNRALAHVTGSHVLFFDADDILRLELRVLWQKLQAENLEFDFCIFQHVEERRRQDGHTGMFAKDEALWWEAGAVHVLSDLAPEMFSHLAQVAAYPWNKIYRTGFLRDNEVRCGETVVHNDIALHWIGFLKAKRILCSTILCCEHVLGNARQHLTHRSGVERLLVFAALEDVLQEVTHIPERWKFAYACFSLDLIGWARQRISDVDLPEFDRRAQAFVRRNLSENVFLHLNRVKPELARRALDMMAGRI